MEDFTTRTQDRCEALNPTPALDVGLFINDLVIHNELQAAVYNGDDNDHLDSLTHSFVTRSHPCPLVVRSNGQCETHGLSMRRIQTEMRRVGDGSSAVLPWVSDDELAQNEQAEAGSLGKGESEADPMDQDHDEDREVALWGG